MCARFHIFCFFFGYIVPKAINIRCKDLARLCGSSTLYSASCVLNPNFYILDRMLWVLLSALISMLHQLVSYWMSHFLSPCPGFISCVRTNKTPASNVRVKKNANIQRTLIYNSTIIGCCNILFHNGGLRPGNKPTKN